MKSVIVGSLVALFVYAIHPVFDLSFWVAIFSMDCILAISFFDRI